MDINGAKALKERLGASGADEAAAAPADVVVPEDAPPVYHWVGVSQAPSETPSADADDDGSAQSASLFSRLGLSFR